MANHVGNDTQGINHGFVNKFGVSPKAQGPNIVVKENKGWVKPKKRSHDHNNNPFMLIRSVTPKDSLQTCDHSELKPTSSKGHMGTILAQDHQTSLVQCTPEDPKPPDQEQLSTIRAKDRILESSEDMVVIPRQLEIDMETDRP